MAINKYPLQKLHF